MTDKRATTHRNSLRRAVLFSRLLALATLFHGLIQSGAVANYSKLARPENVPGARITQIMLLLMPTLEIREELLFLPRV